MRVLIDKKIEAEWDEIETDCMNCGMKIGIAKTAWGLNIPFTLERIRLTHICMSAKGFEKQKKKR